MNNYLTLCAGSSERFFGIPKHFLTVNGEPLLHRQIRQFGPIKVIDKSVVGDTRWTCETLVKTLPLWIGRTVILLADVYFTEEVAVDIQSNTEPLIFWTDTQDIFAFAFDPSFNNDIAAHAQKVISQREVLNEGRLWELYRNCVGLSNEAHLPPDGMKYLKLVKDTTQDFDNPIEYEWFLKGVSKNKLFNP